VSVEQPSLSRRMPAEWLPHDATWLSWPRNRDTWRGHLARAQQEFCLLARTIAEDEPVRVLAGREDEMRAAERQLGGVPQLEIVPIPTNDAWVRDYGPTFVHDLEAGELAAVGWQYNAWGGKYPPFDDDQRVARLVAERLGVRYLPADLRLEGGAVEIDEEGTLLCTRSCAFDPRRNPGLSEDAIERTIRDALGARRVLWLAGDALVGDDTDGHIDQLARFTPGGAILYAWTDDPADPQRAGLARNLADLQQELARHGRRVPLEPLLLPSPVQVDGEQIPACYCNFYITNGSVLVPQFERPEDRRALDQIAEHFPGRRAAGLPSTALTVGLGSFHCLTQQQPRPPHRAA